MFYRIHVHVPLTLCIPETPTAAVIIDGGISLGPSPFAKIKNEFQGLK